MAERQFLKIARKGHCFDALLKLITQSQVQQTTWKGHSLQALIKLRT
jgi:hypothetical protein